MGHRILYRPALACFAAAGIRRLEAIRVHVKQFEGKLDNVQP